MSWEGVLGWVGNEPASKRCCSACASHPGIVNTNKRLIPPPPPPPGHYVAYVRCGSQWFLCDDSFVTPVAAARVLSQAAYLLFYEREAPRQLAVAADGAPAAAAAAADSAAAEGAPVDSAARAAAGAGGMPRVETAPAALLHLRTPGAAATSASSVSELSAASSGDQALAAEPQQEGGVEVGTQESLHGSASDSDLSAARDRSAAATAAQQQQQQQQQQQATQQASAEAKEAAREQQADAASSAQARRLQEHVAAAEAARAQMQALFAEQAGRSMGPASEAGESDGTPSSQQFSGSHFGPTRNPFGLLGGEDEEVEEEEEGDGGGGGGNSDAEGGITSGDTEAQGAASTADADSRQVEQRRLVSPHQAQRQQQQQQASGGGSARQLAQAAAVPMAVAGGTPACAAKASLPCPAAQDQQGAAVQRLPQAEEQPQAVLEPQAEEQPQAAAQARDAAPAGLALAELGLEERPVQGGSADGSGARSPCSASGSSSLDSGSEGGGPQRCTPKHRASVREERASGRRVLRLSVDLPGVGEHEVEWHVAPRAGRQLLVLRAAQFALELPLPVPVAPLAAEAEWAARRQKLTVTLPLIS